MATYIKTLKEDNGDIVYPQTTTDAIYTTGGETLETRISKYVTAEDIAQSVASFGTVTTGMIADDAITTAKIDDGAVTSDKIDWTTMNADGSETQPYAKIVALRTGVANTSPSWGPGVYTSDNETITIDGVAHTNDNTNILSLHVSGADGVSSGSSIVRTEIGVVTYSNTARLRGVLVFRYRHGGYGTNTEWKTFASLNSYEYKIGESLSIGSDVYLPGRQRYENNKKYIWTTLFLDKSVQQGATVTFTPSGYNEAFNESSGTMYSVINPTTSQIKYTCSVTGPNRNIINFNIELVDSSYPVNSNHPCVVHPSGTLNFT